LAKLIINADIFIGINIKKYIINIADGEMIYKNKKFSLEQELTAKLATIVKKINIKQLIFTTNALIYSQISLNDDKYFLIDLFDDITKIYAYEKNTLIKISKIDFGFR
jgi:hypothetical protein